MSSHYRLLNYVKEAEQQFNKKDAIKKLQYDPIQAYSRRLVNDNNTFKKDKLSTEYIAK